MQAEASPRAWLERKDHGSRDTHTAGLGPVKGKLVVLDSRNKCRQFGKI